ncbi:PEP-CTERM sorting domain-containing protein [Synechococcus sp. RC10A2]|uniref:PEP-CTERM sorting domain-containing protein n=1 Tax=Synechococcus sp. RC10A2 TaxID=2964529 RepID=UPI0039C6426E
MSNTAKRWVLMSVLSLAAFAQASASSITFPFNTVHSGATPGGPAPWATMTITNITGGVQISLTNSATNPSGQFIGELNLLFNVLPTGFASGPYVQTINLGNYIDAGLSFNVEVRFKVAPPTARLLPGNTSTFQLFGVSTANFVGANNSAMVHIQNIQPGGDSGKIIAPEPGSLIAIGTGLVSLLGLRRRRK